MYVPAAQSAHTRSAVADFELISTTYDFYQALVQLEVATGLSLMPVGVER